MAASLVWTSCCSSVVCKENLLCEGQTFTHFILRPPLILLISSSKPVSIYPFIYLSIYLSIYLPIYLLINKMSPLLVISYPTFVPSSERLSWCPGGPRSRRILRHGFLLGRITHRWGGDSEWSWSTVMSAAEPRVVYTYTHTHINVHTLATHTLAHIYTTHIPPEAPRPPFWVATVGSAAAAWRWDDHGGSG